MRQILATVISIILVVQSATLLAAGLRSPKMAIDYDTCADTRDWVISQEDISHARILEERVPTGRATGSATEVLELQTVFTPATLQNYLKVWSLQQSMENPDLERVEVTHGPAATLLIYRLPSSKVLAVRKFMKAPDGVYMIAYRAREDMIDYEIYGAWLRTIEHATLVESAGVPSPKD